MQLCHFNAPSCGGEDAAHFLDSALDLIIDYFVLVARNVVEFTARNFEASLDRFFGFGSAVSQSAFQLVK